MAYRTAVSDDSITRPVSSKLRKKPVLQSKVAKVLDEFANDELVSSSGDPVTKRPQALAIAMSEGRRAAGAKAKKP